MSRTLRRLGATVLVAGLPCVAFADAPNAPALPPPSMTMIASKMTVVASDLAKTQTGEPVQKKQARIVRDLDELIAALEKECQGCRAGLKRNNPRRPMRDSMISRGTGGIGDLVDPGPSEKDWAQLSPRERDRILQSMSEGFPPEYRQVLERYYRRLAEETSAQTRGERPPAQQKQKETDSPADQP
jgi:hypothetical protein